MDSVYFLVREFFFIALWAIDSRELLMMNLSFVIVVGIHNTLCLDLFMYAVL